MIWNSSGDEYVLMCDNCTAYLPFNSFQAAVDHKVKRSNGWASLKDKNGEWQELCPLCNTKEIIAVFKGIKSIGST